MFSCVSEEPVACVLISLGTHVFCMYLKIHVHETRNTYFLPVSVESEDYILSVSVCQRTNVSVCLWIFWQKKKKDRRKTKMNH